MHQSDLVARLDAYFEIHAFDESRLWTTIIPPGDLSVYQRFASMDFVQGPWNGLMLDSGNEIDRVYMIVFPDQAVLDTILALELERGAHGALIFASHPADYEESGRGFRGIREVQLEELREHNISYYACHAPLDCHPETSTVAAMAKAIKLRDGEPFGPHYGKFEGLHGKIHETNFGDFAARMAEITDLPYIRYNQIQFNGQPVEHVALIPGGGDNRKFLEAARDLGCDTYITGLWWPMGDSEYAVQQRKLIREIVPTLPMNLLGTSHYASEMIVMRDQMPGWFRNAGIEARFIRQPNPWR